DEVSGAEMGIGRQDDPNRDFDDGGHDRAAIGIDEIQSQAMVTLFFLAKRHAQRDGTLRAHRRKSLGVDQIKCPQQVQLPVFVSRRITQHCHLNIHRFIMGTSIDRSMNNSKCSMLPETRPSLQRSISCVPMLGSRRDCWFTAEKKKKSRSYLCEK